MSKEKQELNEDNIDVEVFADTFDKIKNEKEKYHLNVMKNESEIEENKEIKEKIVDITNDIVNESDNVEEILKIMNDMNIKDEDEDDELDENSESINNTKEFLVSDRDLKDDLVDNKDFNLKKVVKDYKEGLENKKLWPKIKDFFTMNEEKIEPSDDPWFIDEDKKDDNSGEFIKKCKQLYHKKKLVFNKSSENSENNKKKVKPDNNDKGKIIDYSKKEDADIIRREILRSMQKLFIRSVITGILLISSVLLTLSARSSIKFLNFRDDFFDNNLWYLIISLVLLVLSAISCRITILNGIMPLFKFKGNSDSAIAFATLMCLVQGLIAIFAQERFDLNGYSIYSCIAILGLLFNSVGKLGVVRRVRLNFNYITSNKKKFVGKIYSNQHNINFISKEIGTENPVIAYQKESENLSDFLKLSYKPDLSEEFAGRIAPFGVIISLFTFAFSLIINKDIFAAISILAITSCLCVPFASIIAINFPLLKLCKKVCSEGAMIIGYPGILQFADTNLLFIDSNELYGKGSTAIHGVKAFGSFSIDKTILYTSALLSRAQAPLSSTFNDIIKHDGNILPNVEKWEYYDGFGLVSFIQGKRVLVGNRRLLENNNISPPPRSSEEKFLKKGKSVLYVSIGSELSAMFLVSYKPKDDMVYWMQRMEDNGVNFLIRTTDPNVTSKLISEQFRISFKSVKILNEEVSSSLNNVVKEKSKKDRCYVCTNGKITKLSRVLISCIRFRANAIATMITQALTVVLGCCFIIMLEFYAGVNEIKVLNMLAYVFFWIIVVIIIPKIRKV